MTGGEGGRPTVALPIANDRPGFIPGDLHPCAKCASIQRTCCQQAEILVTDGDIQRVSSATGRSDIWELRRPSDPSYLDQDDDPNWLGYTVDARGRRRVLKRQANGDCIFLGPAGCVLGTEERPLVCRLYPFSYTEAGIDGVDDSYCPTSRVVPEGQTILDALGMTLQDGQRWHRALYQELREACAARSDADGSA